MMQMTQTEWQVSHFQMLQAVEEAMDDIYLEMEAGVEPEHPDTYKLMLEELEECRQELLAMAIMH